MADAAARDGGGARVSQDPARPALATLTVPNDVAFVRPAAGFIVEAARAMAVPAAETPLFEVAVSEALANACRHGARDGAEPIRCEVERAAGRLAVRVFDAGAGFELPEASLAPVDPAQVADLPESGYGLPIMRTVFSSVRTLERDGRFGVELVLPV